MFTIFLLVWFFLMNLVSSSLGFLWNQNITDDPFMDPYIRAISAMDEKSISLIPRLNDEDFLEFLADDSRVNMNLIAARNYMVPNTAQDEILIFGMYTDEEWEDMMVSGPLSIQYLGNLLAFSSKRDFPFHSNDTQFTHIKYPSSFRATLVQVSNDMLSALMLAQSSMDKIRLNLRQVPTHIKVVLKLVTSSSDTMIKTMLPRTLSTISRLANDNAAITTSNRIKFDNLQALLMEIIEKSTYTQTNKQSTIEALKRKQEQIEMDRINFEAQISSLKSEQDASKRRVEQLRKEYTSIMKNVANTQDILTIQINARDRCGRAISEVRQIRGSFVCPYSRCQVVTVGVDSSEHNRLVAQSNQVLSNLADAERTGEKFYQDYIIKQNDLMQTINNMAALNFSQLNEEELLDILSESITQISEIKEQWVKMTNFFTAMSTRMDSLQKIIVEVFVDLLTKANEEEILDLAIGREFFSKTMVPLIESIETVAHLLFMAATSYYDISNQFMITQISGVDRLVVLQTDAQRNAHLRQSKDTALEIAAAVSEKTRMHADQYRAEIQSRQKVYTEFLNNIADD